MKSPVPTLGVIIGNRDFFPDKLVAEARADLLKLAEEFGFKAILLGSEETKLGGVETHADARKCAELFRRNRDAKMSRRVMNQCRNSSSPRAWSRSRSARQSRRGDCQNRSACNTTRTRSRCRLSKVRGCWPQNGLAAGSSWLASRSVAPDTVQAASGSCGLRVGV